MGRVFFQCLLRLTCYLRARPRDDPTNAHARGGVQPTSQHLHTSVPGLRCVGGLSARAGGRSKSKGHLVSTTTILKKNFQIEFEVFSRGLSDQHSKQQFVVGWGWGAGRGWRNEIRQRSAVLCVRLFDIENPMCKKGRVTVSPLSPSFKIRTPRGTHK